MGAIGTEAASLSETGGLIGTWTGVSGWPDGDEGGGTEVFSATTGGPSVVVSGLVRAIGSSTTCSITEGMIGGKYPSPFNARLGDIVIGAVSLRLVGNPLIIPLVRVLNGGSTGRTDDPMTDVGDVS